MGGRGGSGLPQGAGAGLHCHRRPAGLQASGRGRREAADGRRRSGQLNPGLRRPSSAPVLPLMTAGRATGGPPNRSPRWALILILTATRAAGRLKPATRLEVRACILLRLVGSVQGRNNQLGRQSGQTPPDESVIYGTQGGLTSPTSLSHRSPALSRAPESMPGAPCKRRERRGDHDATDALAGLSYRRCCSAPAGLLVLSLHP